MIQEKTKLHWEILDKKRVALLPKLKFLKDAGFYLAGGTALALQMKHRTSVDFDFYHKNTFNSEKILDEFQRNCKEVVLIQKAENTLILKADGIDISLFTYSYKLVRPLIETENLNLASLEDIAAMKLVAIIQRGVRRDFVDLYFLINQLSLKKIFQLTEEKYPPFNKYLGIQALTYFGDAEIMPPERKIILFQSLTWEETKKFIIMKVKEFKDILIYE